MDPLQPPRVAPIFWLPQDDTSVVVLTPAPILLTADDEDHPFFLNDAVRTASDGVHALYDLANSQQLQILCLGAVTTEALAAVVPLGIGGFDRLEAVRRLLAALHGRVVPPETRLTRQQRARARRMLQAWDGARDGATQQEIAQVIFQIGDLDRDEWQASSARHAVMGLLRGARSMIAGGYRKLLRHRHRR
ncbi:MULTISPECIES: DUF2285 domain-containing protein [Alphaproteobacteria]|uniref:DUF2285 domain-containing protein n=1 Tax=Asaia lannensis TaxID=415421 RepID=UPI002443CE9B|nr:DUF2285 domain-containing protein [Sphingobium yanoikuyae]